MLVQNNLQIMKNLLLILFMLLAKFSFAQDPDSVWFVNNMVKKEVQISMRDGVKLFTAIYSPKDLSAKHPILMVRTPYSCAPYGGQKPFPIFWKSYYKQYAHLGFIMVVQDVRGRWMSEGKYDFMPPYIEHKRTKSDIDEASDAYDTIDWLVKNVSGNNGRVGATGVSFPGYYAMMAAASGHPALKAVSPQAPVTDRFMGDDDHHNGALFLMDAFDFMVVSGMARPHHRPDSIGSKQLDYPEKDHYAFYLQTGALPNFTKIAGDSLQIWKQMMDHPNYDTFWQLRDSRRSLKNIKPAVLIVGGLFDAEDLYGTFHSYRSLIENSPATDTRLVIGPWYHGQWLYRDGSKLGNIQFGSNTNEYYTQQLEIPFFSYYLNRDGKIDAIAKSTVFFTGMNQWKKFDQWPPKEVGTQSLYFHKGGKLTFLPGSDREATESYVSDPAKPVPYSENTYGERTREYMTDDQRLTARRTDVLTFQTDVLEKDMTLAGSVTADLTVAVTGTDADFIVKLIDVFPANLPANAVTKHPMGGYQMLVRAEIMRGKYRHSFTSPEPFVPGKPTVVKFSLNDVAHSFLKGHKIMVQIQSSWFPLADRNPQQFIDINKANDADFQKATISIYPGRLHLDLPVLKYN
jgi:putative CocE/NonD family hydrolase